MTLGLIDFTSCANTQAWSRFSPSLNAGACHLTARRTPAGGQEEGREREGSLGRMQGAAILPMSMLIISYFPKVAVLESTTVNKSCSYILKK